MCVSVSTRGQRVSLRTPCARGRNSLCRLRDPSPLRGTPGRAWLQPRGSPGSANLPEAQYRKPRAVRPSTGLLRIPGSLAQRPQSHQAARARDARSAPGKAAGSPRPGRQAGGTPTTRLSLLSRHPDSAPPSQIKPLSRTPQPASGRFFNTRGAQTLPRTGSEGKQGPEPKAGKKPPNLPAVFLRFPVLCRLHGPRTRWL